MKRIVTTSKIKASLKRDQECDIHITHKNSTKGVIYNSSESAIFGERKR